MSHGLAGEAACLKGAPLRTGSAGVGTGPSPAHLHWHRGARLWRGLHVIPRQLGVASAVLVCLSGAQFWKPDICFALSLFWHLLFFCTCSGCVTLWILETSLFITKSLWMSGVMHVPQPHIQICLRTADKPLSQSPCRWSEQACLDPDLGLRRRCAGTPLWPSEPQPGLGPAPPRPHKCHFVSRGWYGACLPGGLSLTVYSFVSVWLSLYSQVLLMPP